MPDVSIFFFFIISRNKTTARKLTTIIAAVASFRAFWPYFTIEIFRNSILFDEKNIKPSSFTCYMFHVYQYIDITIICYLNFNSSLEVLRWSNAGATFILGLILSLLWANLDYQQHQGQWNTQESKHGTQNLYINLIALIITHTCW